MNKKALGVFLTGALFLFCSCVDDTYDLANKEIVTEAESKDFKLALPLGSLKPFELGTWFQDLDIVETMEDGVYAFVHKDSIAPLEKMPHDIVFNIPAQHIASTIDVSEQMPTIPDIPDIPDLPDFPNMARAASDFLENIPNPIVIPFDENNTFSFKNPISVQYMYIESVSLKQEEIITLSFKLDGLQALEESEVLLNLDITLPAIFNKIRSNDPTITTDGNKVSLQKVYPVQSGVGISFDLICDEIHFKNEETSGVGLHPENGVLAYDGEILAQGTVSINWSEKDLLNSIKDIDEIGVNVDCSLTPMYVQTINGIFYEEFGTLEQAFSVDLGEQMNSLKGSENTITLSDPQLCVLLNNTISVPIDVDLDIVGKDIYGEPIASEEIHTHFPIHAAKYDEITGLVVPDISMLYFTDEPHEKDGYENIIIENLGHLLENVPDSIYVSIHPNINKDVLHHIDIEQAFNISASYDLLVPFRFDCLHISYNDTIDVGLGETMETIGDASLNLRMNITNSIPLELKLNLTALDEDNRHIEDIAIEPIIIAQGNGGSIHGKAAGKSEVSLALNNKNGNLAKLDKLKLEVEIQSTDASMGLKGTQGIQISDIVVEVSGKMNLNKEETEEDIED